MKDTMAETREFSKRASLLKSHYKTLLAQAELFANGCTAQAEHDYKKCERLIKQYDGEGIELLRKLCAKMHREMAEALSEEDGAGIFM